MCSVAGRRWDLSGTAANTRFASVSHRSKRVYPSSSKGWIPTTAVELTRSRPYCKNDQAYVEQKNYTHVRQRLGYGRMEHEELIGYRRAQGQEFQVGELEALLECHHPIQMKEDIEKRLKSIASKTQKLRTQKEKDRVRLRCAPTTPDLAQTKRPKPRTKKKSATVSPIMSQRART